MSVAQMILSLAKAALNTCKSAKECQEEAVRIGKRLQYLIARSDAWSVVLSNDSELASRVYNGLNEIFLCVQAASTKEQNWSRKVKIFLRGNTLQEELRKAENNFEGIMRELQLEINAILMEKMELGFSSIAEVLAKFASETKMIKGRGQTIQDQIDKVLADCHREKKIAQSIDGTEPSTSSSRTLSTLNFDENVPEIEISDLKYSTSNEEDRLGRGGFATVYRGLYQDDKPVAIKVIDLDFDSIKHMSDQQLQHEINQVLAEVTLMKKCSINPNVVDVYGCYFKDIRREQHPLIVMELLDITMYDIIHHHSFCGEILSYTQRLHLMVGIANAVEFLHIRGIIHHDIKTRNILVNKEKTVAKLSDFGEAKNKELKTTRQVITNTLNYQQVAGTVPYQAPEILEGVVRESSRVSEMYSFGVTIWECWTGNIPHKGKREADITMLAANRKSEPMLPIPTEPYGEELSEDDMRAWEILQMTAKQCLSRDRKERPNATLALKMLEGSIHKADLMVHIKKQQQRKTFIQKHPYKILLVCIVFLIVLVIIVILLQPPPPPPPPPEVLCFQSRDELRNATFYYLDRQDAYIKATYGNALNDWCVSNIEDFSYLFNGLDGSDKSDPRYFLNSASLKLNEPLDQWDTSAAADMTAMFQKAQQFNQDISLWNVGNVKSMSAMFAFCDSFDSSISDWDVSSVLNMSSMFFNALAFNQPLNQWDVRAVQDASYMFSSAKAFNQPLGNWQLTSALTVDHMFLSAESFSQNLCNWTLPSNATVTGMFSLSACTDDSEPYLVATPQTPLCEVCTG